MNPYVECNDHSCPLYYDGKNHDIVKCLTQYELVKKLNITIYGKFNEIHTSDIGEGTKIANFCFIGNDVKIGKNCKIGNFCEINSGTVIGDNTLINPYSVLNSNTIVGHDTIFGANVMTADEKYMTVNTEKIIKTPCVIGNHVKLGQGTRLICCKVGDYSSIGAGSVVLNNIPERQVWAGIPAKYIRDANKYEMSL